MDARKKANPRTPQPPAGARDGGSGSGSTSKPPSQPRPSRSSTPTATTDTAAAALTSPTAAGVTGARPSAASRQPKTGSSPNNNNNTSSPRAPHPTRKPSREEPATDDDDASNRFQEPPKDEWLRQSEVTLAALEKQVHDAAKRTLKHQTRCSTMKDFIVGKEERMDTLRGTYASLSRALEELELISNGDLDSDALEEMYNSIPSDDRDSALVHASE